MIYMDSAQMCAVKSEPDRRIKWYLAGPLGLTWIVVALPLLAWLLVVMEIGPASSWNNFDITNHQPASVKTITNITSFQIIELLSFVIRQSSLTLTKFLEKKYMLSTIPNKCTIKTYFMKNLTKPIWCCRSSFVFL